MDVRSIGGALGAAMLLEGSVRRQSERVRVTAQLTEVATGVHLWSGILEREVRDGWAVQQEIAKAVATSKLRERFSERGVELKASANPEAFAALVKTEFDKKAKLAREANIRID